MSSWLFWTVLLYLFIGMIWDAIAFGNKRPTIWILSWFPTTFKLLTVFLIDTYKYLRNRNEIPS